MIRLVNGRPYTPESSGDKQRREARAELYKQHRYGGDPNAAWALMMADMSDGTYDKHVAEWVHMLEAAHLSPAWHESQF